MPLQKQNININFAKGVETKTDPFQIPFDNFLLLRDSVFNNFKRLTKRNGFGSLPALPDTTNTYITTFNGNLTALGSTLNALSDGSDTWVEKGNLRTVDVRTLGIIRNNTNQSQVDSALDSSGLMCTVYTDNVPVSGSNVAQYKYAISDSVTGQFIVNPTVIPVTSGVVTGSPRVFLLGRYFVIVFNNVFAATNHIQYVSIPISNPTTISANVNVSSSYTPSASVAFDGVVANNSLYLAWNGADGGGAIRATYIDSTLTQHGTSITAGFVCTLISICADTTLSSPNIWITFYDLATRDGYVMTLSSALVTILAPVNRISGGGNPITLNLATVAKDNLLYVFWERDFAYSYDAAIKTNRTSFFSVTPTGAYGPTYPDTYGTGLASKAFIYNDQVYVWLSYQSTNQNGYYLRDLDNNIIAKLAYQNGGGFLTKGLPSVTVMDNTIQFSYLFKDLIQSVNKTQGISNSAGVYAQLGINLGTLTFTTDHLVSAEIGSDLNLSGGFLWMYDGVNPVEQGFFNYPENLKVTTSTTGGNITAQTYFYSATYEWADNQGNIFRSAPSIPVTIVTTGSTSTNTVNIPTLRLTYKIDAPVKIVVYRWSTAQQIYYQATSVLTPLLNDPTVDSLVFTDTQADSSIIGNNILYTTGGVIENISAPGTSAMALYRSRLFLIDAEDRNLVWYSKQVIEDTPVEMSDLLTIYVAPTTGAQGSTGELSALGAMDDKLILFKPNAVYYLTGNGPDNTGANNDFSEPVFVNSTIGCDNQNSIVFIPAGLIFQSNKGLWLLGRDLSTQYIGSPVEAYNDLRVLSATAIPSTNQVRFTLEGGITLMYDYFYGQWAIFSNVSAISSTIYQGLHTYINALGEVFQETPGTYLDGTRPVLIKFKTAWFNLAGLQGFERAYFFYLLGVYLSPHKLSVQIAYDYNASPTQTVMITPLNTSSEYGDDPLYGSYEYGGGSNIEQWKVFLERQKCEAFQITVEELYDPSQGIAAGAGLTLSGIDLVVGVKSGYPRLKAATSIG